MPRRCLDDFEQPYFLTYLLSQLVDTPFYAELRTRQQLGYIVGSSIAESEGTPARHLHSPSYHPSP